MIAHETLRAVAIRARGDSITLSIEGYGFKRCPSANGVAEEAQEWLGFPLEVSGLVARNSRGRLVSLTVQSIKVLRPEERAQAAELAPAKARRGPCPSCGGRGWLDNGPLDQFRCGGGCDELGMVARQRDQTI